jgi:hydrophobic/amphiphilic exporter-1 (mainly G- bacteria), HAE1 family
MSISSAFIARPIATSLLMAGILLVGAAAYPLLPVAPLPQVDFPTILVTTQLPGASPEIMASSVTQPLERQFGQIPGVTQMTSSSALGNSAITVQFDLSRNIDGAAQDIQTAINAASGQLPKNLPSPPTYRKVNPADSPILVLALTSDTVPLTEVDDYAENILDHVLNCCVTETKDAPLASRISTILAKSASERCESRTTAGSRSTGLLRAETETVATSLATR